MRCERVQLDVDIDVVFGVVVVVVVVQEVHLCSRLRSHQKLLTGWQGLGYLVVIDCTTAERDPFRGNSSTKEFSQRHIAGGLACMIKITRPYRTNHDAVNFEKIVFFFSLWLLRMTGMFWSLGDLVGWDLGSWFALRCLRACFMLPVGEEGMGGGLAGSIHMEGFKRCRVERIPCFVVVMYSLCWIS